MAAEIESLNANFFKIPNNCENSMLIKFSSLPEILRTYAKTLNHTENTIRTSFHAPTVDRRLVEFSGFVKRMTGGNFDKEATELLNTAANAMNPEGKRELIGSDATQLMQARYRHHRSHS